MTTAAATQFLPVIATANAAKGALVVSIHDLAPANRDVVESVIARLARLGVPVCSLLVVPNYHHRQPIAEDASFLSWLRDLAAQGHEIVIHGFFHKRPPRPNETMTEKWITRSYTQGEGEFFDLNYDEAFRRIASARDIFAASGLKPRGFIAPAWLLNTDGERAARDAGLEYTTRLQTVSDLRTGEHFSAQSLVYSVHNKWRRVASLAWNATLFAVSRQKPLLRISIHPPDTAFSRIWGQIEGFVRQLAEVRTPTTYQDWIAEQRVEQPGE
jgi:predicted deacetylase